MPNTSDTTMNWNYSMGLTPTGISSDFVSFSKLPDTLISWSKNDCSPVCSTVVNRKTNVGVCQINGRSYPLLTREDHKAISIGDSVNGSDDNIVTSWSDSIGMCQKIFLNNYSTPVLEGSTKPKTGSNYERFILLRYNGFAITSLSVGVKPTDHSHAHTHVLTKNAPVYFDLYGRKLQGEFGQLRNHGIAIRQFPDGQCDLKAIVR